jgi:hypothetical protein
MIVSLVQSSTSALAIFTSRVEARRRMRDFFSSHIRNRNTRRAYLGMVHSRQNDSFCRYSEKPLPCL